MINLLLGQPGGGKSYEAVAFHILPALDLGRKVITNMPLDIEQLCTINPDYRDLIHCRHVDLEIDVPVSRWNLYHRVFDRHVVKKTFRPFSSLQDYGSPWRHPKTGTGPLYVIDECHKCLPRVGTPIDVEEWFSEHRHEFADVLLISQSYGKVNKAIIDLVQVCYRVKKATAFGTNNSYIRKVLDGVRGEVVNEGIRSYNPAFFRFYKSHTRSDSAGAELAANDIKPIWFRWPFIGAGICLALFIILLSAGASVNPMSAATAAERPQRSEDAQAAVIPPTVPVPVVALDTVPSISVPAVLESYDSHERQRIQGAHPYESHKLHIVAHVVGWITIDNVRLFRDRYTFSASQNGVVVFSLSQADLEKAGYTVLGLNDCSVKITYQELQFYSTCDLPVQNIISSSETF